MPYLDLSSEPSPPKQNPAQIETKKPADNTRRFIGVKFNCCGTYVHVYMNRDQTAYEGRCPKCFKPIKLKIGEGGTDCRFFEVY
jgi:hypothetical protein